MGGELRDAITMMGRHASSTVSSALLYSVLVLRPPRCEAAERIAEPVRDHAQVVQRDDPRVSRRDKRSRSLRGPARSGEAAGSIRRRSARTVVVFDAPCSPLITRTGRVGRPKGCDERTDNEDPGVLVDEVQEGRRSPIDPPGTGTGGGPCRRPDEVTVGR